jgi:hypothetical protein
MAQIQHTPAPSYLEEAITGLFCLVDDTYAPLNSRGDCYGALKKLSDSELLALFHQLRGVKTSQHSSRVEACASSGWPVLHCSAGYLRRRM